MKKSTLTSLLAQPTQPVLAHNLLLHLDVTVRAIKTLGAAPTQVELANLIFQKKKKKKKNKRKEKKN